LFFKNHAPPFLAFLISILVMMGYNWGLFTHLNSYLLGDAIDGLKNYYTPLYHILFDSSYNHFEGMNFPLGEHVVFSDNQPLISNTIKFISNNIVDVSKYTIGIINLLMLLSVPLAAAILAAIFKSLNLRNWQAIFGAVVISLLSPQLARMGGHYALSYSFVIPLTIWMWIKHNELQKLLFSLAIGLIITMVSGIHMYYFGIACFTLAGAHFFQLALNKLHNLKWVLVHLFLQVVLPFILLQLWINTGSEVVDRPNNPFGFFEYSASLSTILIPIGKPLVYLFNLLFTIPEHSWEGIAYIGLPATAFVIIWFINKLLYRTFNFSYVFTPLQLSALALLILSFGYPFVGHFQFLIDYAGPLKQFRGIGRFAWVFFFVINISAVKYYFSCFNKNPSPKKLGLFLLLAIIFVVEIHQHHNRQLYQTNELSYFSNPANIKKEFTAINPSDYSAIIPVPYFHTGSENIWFSTENSSIYKGAFISSLQTGLPITAVQMSRTSLSQTLLNLSLVYEKTEWPNLFPKDKPYLLVYENGVKLSKAELELVYLSEKISSFDGFELKALNPKVIEKYLKENSTSNDVAPTKEQATKALMNDYNTLFKTENDSSNSTDIKFWYYLNQDVNPTVQLIAQEYNAAGKIANYTSSNVFSNIKRIDGDWALISYSIEKESSNQMEFLLQKNTFKNRDIWYQVLGH